MVMFGEVCILFNLWPSFGIRETQQEKVKVHEHIRALISYGSEIINKIA